MTYRKGTCSRPDPGWNCTGDEGHDGPCASWPDDPRLDPSFEEIVTVYEFGVAVGALVIVGLLGIGFLIGLAVGHAV